MDCDNFPDFGDMSNMDAEYQLLRLFGMNANPKKMSIREVDWDALIACGFKWTQLVHYIRKWGSVSVNDRQFSFHQASGQLFLDGIGISFPATLTALPPAVYKILELYTIVSSERNFVFRNSNVLHLLLEGHHDVPPTSVSLQNCDSVGADICEWLQQARHLELDKTSFENDEDELWLAMMNGSSNVQSLKLCVESSTELNWNLLKLTIEEAPNLTDLHLSFLGEGHSLLLTDFLLASSKSKNLKRVIFDFGYRTTVEGWFPALLKLIEANSSIESIKIVHLPIEQRRYSDANRSRTMARLQSALSCNSTLVHISMSSKHAMDVKCVGFLDYSARMSIQLILNFNMYRRKMLAAIGTVVGNSDLALLGKLLCHETATRYNPSVMFEILRSTCNQIKQCSDDGRLRRLVFYCKQMADIAQVTGKRLDYFTESYTRLMRAYMEDLSRQSEPRYSYRGYWHDILGKAEGPHDKKYLLICRDLVEVAHRMRRRYGYVAEIYSQLDEMNKLYV